MNVDDVLNRWMVAGFSAKAAQKERLESTPGGRLPLGQMGIGRFATARIGRRLMVISKKDGSPEVFFEIDWDAYSKGGDVGDVEIAVEERDPKFFTDGRTGTRIVMLGAPDPWTEQDVRAVHRKLLRLISPVHVISNFEVTLSIPEYPEYQRLQPEKILDNFHYHLVADVNGDGVATITVRNVLRGVDVLSETVNLWQKVPRTFFGLDRRNKPVCGPFRADVRAWKLRKAELEAVHIKDPKAVQELAGVSVFRDNFRILPYGEYGNDWLELNKRRVNNPTARFSTNQLIGLVDVDSARNPGLLDQANRLGLQQNAAFADFRQLVLACVGELEARSLLLDESDRRRARASVFVPGDASRPVVPPSRGRAGSSEPSSPAGKKVAAPERPRDTLVEPGKREGDDCLRKLEEILVEVQLMASMSTEPDIKEDLKVAEASLQNAAAALKDGV